MHTIGQRVEGGEVFEDYDVGAVVAVEGDQVTVRWDSGPVTRQHARVLRPEGARPIARPTDEED